MTAPICPTCNLDAELVTGEVVYPHRQDLFEKSFWKCPLCAAFVGCHPGTTRALGTPADGELRRLRSAVHAGFDPRWKSGRMTRSEAYEWFAHAMEMPKRDCHIGRFTKEQCERALSLL